MKLPMLNITIKDWGKNIDELDYSILFIETGFIYTANKIVFNKFYLNHEYIDSNGIIFKLIGKEQVTGWRKIVMSIIPFSYKAKLYFEKTNKKLSLPELKIFITENIETFSGKEEFEIAWLNSLKTATTYQEVIKQYGE